jgi:hypothetical protein
MNIENVEIMGLESAVKASKYPMAVDTSSCNSKITKTVESLGQSGKGEGHDQFLTGVNISFDLTFTNKAWIEMERYRFVFFVSSQSTMHKISKFDFMHQYNDYVDYRMIAIMEELKEVYNTTGDKEDYLKLLYSNPAGFNITARLTTSYRSLKTIFGQRRTHRLPEWREFCEWIEGLPHFKELCLKSEVSDEA